ASLTPYHVTRSKLFVRERFGKVSLIPIDTMQIEANIEHTRFPVPEDEQHNSTADYPGLVRAADLIGQLADVNYLRKIPALFAEFRETGINEKLGFRKPGRDDAGISVFVLLALRRLGGVPQRVHLGQRRLPRRLADVRERALDRGETALELGVGRAQCRLRIGVEMAREVDDGEQEIADLAGKAIALTLHERALDLVGLLADFREQGVRIVPVEPDRRRLLLQLERAGERR